MNLSTFFTKVIGEKKEYRQAKARLDALPDPYATAANALHRYLLYYGGVTDGDTIVQMFVDFTDLWERAAVDEVPLRAIVGDDPVEFAELFAQSYAGKHWIDKERTRLIKTFQELEGDEPQ